MNNLTDKQKVAFKKLRRIETKKNITEKDKLEFVRLHRIVFGFRESLPDKYGNRKIELIWGDKKRTFVIKRRKDEKNLKKCSFCKQDLDSKGLNKFARENELLKNREYYLIVEEKKKIIKKRRLYYDIYIRALRTQIDRLWKNIEKNRKIRRIKNEVS